MMQPTFNQAAIKRMLTKKVENMFLAVLTRLVLIGEAFIRNARESGAYNDITGNLRSSIGFMVLRDGVIWAEVFEGDTAEGQQKGRALALEIAQRHPKGCVLIVVAGMEYAAAVESKGRDVLTGSSIIAENQLREAISKLAAWA